MPTNTVSGLGRQTQYQVVHTLRITVNFNDAGIATGNPKQWLPAGAILTGTDVMIDTVFNAVTTNVLTVGTNGPSTYDNIVAAADASEAAVALTQNIKPTGTALGKLTAAAQVFAKFTQSGTAATTGKAYVIIKYSVDNDL